jgi:signal transduction histidine kinase
LSDKISELEKEINDLKNKINELKENGNDKDKQKINSLLKERISKEE